MRLVCSVLLFAIAIGCGGGGNAPIPPDKPTPPPGTAFLEGAGMDGGEQTTGSTKKALTEN